MMLFNHAAFGADTKTAYTRDGINFVSESRMNENIKYEYAKPSDYKEVQVPLNTIVVGASEYLEDTSNQAETKYTQTSKTNQPSHSSASGSSGNGIIFLIGILLIIGATIYWGAKHNKTAVQLDTITSPEPEEIGRRTDPQNEPHTVTTSIIQIGEEKNNDIRNIGVSALVLGIAGYILPIWNGRSIVDMANLCNSPLGWLAQGLGGSDTVSTCGQVAMTANIIYAAILIGVVMILYSAIKK